MAAPDVGCMCRVRVAVQLYPSWCRRGYSTYALRALLVRGGHSVATISLFLCFRVFSSATSIRKNYLCAKVHLDAMVQRSRKTLIVPGSVQRLLILCLCSEKTNGAAGEIGYCQRFLLPSYR